MSDERFKDPSAYRIEYSLAVQHLLAVSEPPERKSRHLRRPRGQEEPPVQLRQTVERIRRQLLPGEEELKPDVECARRIASELVRASASELVRQGWRWPGRRPPWYVRWLRRGTNRRLAEFLDRVLEPATVVLYWSCEAQGGELPWWEKGEASPLDRKALLASKEEAIEQQWLAAYLAELLGPDPEPSSRWRRFLAWIGFSRLRRRQQPDPRVRYNLACLFSRLAGRRYVVANERPDERLRRSAEQLRLALEGMSGRQRETLARWAEEDPGLRNLRTMDSPFSHRGD